MPPDRLLELRGVSLSLPGRVGRQTVVSDIGFDLQPGRIMALIGASGSGKTLIAKSIIDLLPAGGRIDAGEMFWRGGDLLAEPSARKALRGREIGYIFQEPLAALNPALRVDVQMTEAIRRHRGMGRSDALRTARDWLDRARVSRPDAVLRQYPHQLSGGMRQRVMIASVLMLRPALVIADEPTTALDMGIRGDILRILTDTAADIGSAILYISHDLASVAFAGRVCLIEHGRMAEAGTPDDLFERPSPAARRLLEAIPRPRRAFPVPDRTPPLVEADNLSVTFPPKRNQPAVKALEGVTLRIEHGKTLAIIGESGSGKTTLARVLGGLQQPTSGTCRFVWESGRRGRKSAGTVQYIFQDPAGALDPRMRVGDTIAESLSTACHAVPDTLAAILDALRAVGLDEQHAARFPHELSGGQKQRVCIARAIAPRPSFIIADEPASGLDMITQRTILELFVSIKKRFGFASLLVSHDMGVVEHAADDVGVFLKGRLIEFGPVEQIFNRPEHPYTRRLLEATHCVVPDTPHGYRLSTRLDEIPAPARATTMPHIDSIYRYPIKSLSGQKLHAVALTENYGVPGDRAYAFLQRDVPFDSAAPEHYGKRHFLNLMEHERMAEFNARFDDAGTYLTLTRGGERVFEGDLAKSENRRLLSEIFAGEFREEAVSPPHLLAAPGHMFTDIREDGLSVLNLESIRALGRAAGATLDPRRFRANIYLEGLAPWAERQWEPGRIVTLGGVRTRVLKKIGRCRAITVDPATGKRDLDLPRVLADNFDRNVMGVYVLVSGNGVISIGDPVEIESGDARQA